MHRTATGAVTALLTLALLPAAASARTGDRDHDKMPDRWEKAHHLNTHRNDARRDPDHDGLDNLQEYRAGDDPRRADTDRDGTPDGEERAGTVTSFTGGVLTITEFDGTVLRGTVGPATELSCGDHERDGVGRGDHHGGDTGDDDGDRTTAPTTSAREDGDNERDDNDSAEVDEGGATCGPSALTPGAVVHEATLAVTSTGNVWTEVELVAPAAS